MSNAVTRLCGAPPEIEHGLIARETMDVDDANTTLAE
jgi:hypothetical protein